MFCPPRILLPERPEPFCLFLDELPACAPDVQKAFYSLLLERRLGEHALPAGTWVVAAGNRLQDRALVRAMSSALVNRVTILHLRVDIDEWLAWAQRHGVRGEIRSFIASMPDALMRPVPAEPVPFSTPRAWALLSRALDLAESVRHPDQRDAPRAGVRAAVGRRTRRCSARSPRRRSAPCGRSRTTSASPICCRRATPRAGSSSIASASSCATARPTASSRASINRFLRSLSSEHQLTVLTDMVEQWGALGADRAMFDLLQEGDRDMSAARSAKSRRDRATLARIAQRPADGHRAAAASGRPGGRRARRRSTSACRPWACSRPAGWSPIRTSPRGSTTTTRVRARARTAASGPADP